MRRSELRLGTWQCLIYLSRHVLSDKTRLFNKRKVTPLAGLVTYCALFCGCHPASTDTSPRIDRHLTPYRPTLHPASADTSPRIDRYLYLRLSTPHSDRPIPQPTPTDTKELKTILRRSYKPFLAKELNCRLKKWWGISKILRQTICEMNEIAWQRLKHSRQIHSLTLMVEPFLT